MQKQEFGKCFCVSNLIIFNGLYLYNRHSSHWLRAIGIFMAFRNSDVKDGF
jgi:hypothetical protein